MVSPTRHRGQYVFNVLGKSLALRKMKLSADDLVVLAVVSGNDYASNIPGKAMVTNVNIFQKIMEKGDFSKEEMLREYLRLCQSRLPPVLKVSPKVVAFDDDQYQEPKEVPKAKAGKYSSKEKAKRAPSGRSSRTKNADDDNSHGSNTSNVEH
ncbi:hypothetical protein SeMB42_g03793 [Synchytrium endobioticum]|uniref:Uncharacterized protein n=1 Tax=Synchytrium endobioticum TaxID=286115 RepID=A0A507D4H0_9FUNG|nr:hypothetical protein SeLEV6574_g04747 [Synchytrium endobioticum]TPX46221.1 hypothetical protein SeMB42_g03793 [Synchytrium endobioticum]